MLKSVRYAATPHAVARNHKIPIGVIEYLTGKREQDALDGKRCLFEVLVVSHAEVPTVLPPVVLEPRSGGEVRFGKKVSPAYPEAFSPGEFLLVQITEIQR
jgi:hypothetical protein